MDTQIQSLSQVEAVIDRVQIKAQTLSSDQSRAMAVAYLEARDVAQRLDDVCGPENWSDSYHVLQPGPAEWVVECRLSIGQGRGPNDSALPVGQREMVTKCDVGLGDDAKAAYSDAFKRAAVKFGLGRFLYTLPKVWGAYDNSKRRFSDPSAVRAQMLQVHLPSHSERVVQDAPTTRTSTASKTVVPVTAAPVSPNLSEKQMHWLTEDLLRRPGVEVTVQACFEKIDSLSRAKRALGYLLSEKDKSGSTSLLPRFERVGSPEEWRKFIDEAKQLPLALPLTAGQ